MKEELVVHWRLWGHDGYLKELGKGFLNKLSRTNLTGIQQHSPFYFPWQVYIHFAKLATAYGAELVTKRQGKRLKTIVITIKSEESARKLWHTKRLSSINYLAKRKYKRCLILMEWQVRSQFIMELVELSLHPLNWCSVSWMVT